MRSYNERWNLIRATKALGWKTPNQCIEQSFVTVLAYMTMMKEKYARDHQSIYNLDKEGNAFVAIPKPTPVARKEAKAKKVTKVDRYLQWLDWDQKDKLKSFLPLPVMSQIFSS